MNKVASSGIWEWQIVLLLLSGTLLLFGGHLYWYGFTEESVRWMIQWTIKIDVVCFCLAFGASSFHHLVQNSFSFWVYMNRKYFGISFALLHLLHLAVLGLLQYAFHPVFEQAATISLLAGGLAYLFTLLMLLTSFERFSKQITRKSWKRLHTIGAYWITIIFLISYIKRVVNDQHEYWIFLVLIFSMLALRGLAAWKRYRMV